MAKIGKNRIGLVFILILLVGGAFWFWNRKGDQPANPELRQAGKEGEKITHKLMVQIENPQGRPEDIAGRYERGDIVLIFPADHQFSLAEQEGFLILQMEMTPAQADILVRALEERKSEEELQNKGEGESETKMVKRRKFGVDLSQIGIAPDDQKGREIEDQIFGWGIITEK